MGYFTWYLLMDICDLFCNRKMKTKKKVMPKKDYDEIILKPAKRLFKSLKKAERKDNDK